MDQTRDSQFDLATRLINGPLTDRSDATCDSLFALYYALKCRFPGATSWKLTTHGAHGFYLDLTFQHLGQAVRISVMHDREAHEKRFWFEDAYFDRPTEVISAIVTSQLTVDT
jgi:hypothetical protein